jgi:hypothetical protein
VWHGRIARHSRCIGIIRYYKLYIESLSLSRVRTRGFESIATGVGLSSAFPSVLILFSLLPSTLSLHVAARKTVSAPEWPITIFHSTPRLYLGQHSALFPCRPHPSYLVHILLAFSSTSQRAIYPLFHLSRKSPSLTRLDVRIRLIINLLVVHRIRTAVPQPTSISEQHESGVRPYSPLEAKANFG